MRLSAWLSLVLACICLAPAPAEEKADQKKPSGPEAEAAEDADRLYDLLRGLGTPKKQASDLANRYEDFRLLPAEQRQRKLEDLRMQRENRLADASRERIRRHMQSKGRGPGSGLHVNMDNAERMRVDMLALEKKDPKAFEARASDPETRSAYIRQHGFSKDDVAIVEPYVFGDPEARAELRRVRSALKAGGLDEDDAPWVLGEVPSLGDLLEKGEARPKDKPRDRK